MATTNPITGDPIATRFGSKEAQKKFDQSFDTIFGAKKKTNGGWTPPPLPEYSEDWQSEKRDRAIAQNGNVGYSSNDIE